MLFMTYLFSFLLSFISGFSPILIIDIYIVWISYSRINNFKNFENFLLLFVIIMGQILPRYFYYYLGVRSVEIKKYDTGKKIYKLSTSIKEKIGLINHLAVFTSSFISIPPSNIYDIYLGSLKYDLKYFSFIKFTSILLRCIILFYFPHLILFLLK